MFTYSRRISRVATKAFGAAACAAVLVACGGGGSTGNPATSNVDQTYLDVAASDPRGAALHYQWRVNAGSIQNVDSNQTVWTLPDGHGLHFAYVLVSNGFGGYVQQQYAVSSDTLGTVAAVPAPVAYTAPALSDFDGALYRLRFASPDSDSFASPSGATAGVRTVYLPDLQVQVVRGSDGSVVFSGSTDLGGEVALPKLQSGLSYAINCAPAGASTLASCGSLAASSTAALIDITPAASTLASGNLHLFGHVALADGSTCGIENEFFGIQSAATVQLLDASGSAQTPAVRVDRYGDYALFAAVPVNASGLQLAVRCEAYSSQVALPAGSGTYSAGTPVELSVQIPGGRPTIQAMNANGADGNVRGSMVQVNTGQASDSQPGALQFLTYKGHDTARSACQYYKSLGAVRDCDAQGTPLTPISLRDWVAAKGFNSGTVYSADYVNKMDLNLQRHMLATQSAANDMAFYVCNHPGPVGTTQAEIDQVIADGQSDLKQVACVAMEWSVSPGVNNGQPFTKFLTFAPDGSLLLSVNLDGRGEKYMPGACVACHGGSRYNGRFPSADASSPLLGSNFLPFDTGNYLFSSNPALTEANQGAAVHSFNTMVAATAYDSTQSAANQPPVVTLVQGWYANGGTTLDKSYVPPAWQQADAATPGAARFYQQIVGSSCRTCHAALGSTYDWNSIVLTPARASSRVCGGTAALALNASMPNALISLDQVNQRVQADATLAALMTQFLGCSAPGADPVYPRK